MIGKALIALAAALICAPAHAQDAASSAVYAWEAMPAVSHEAGERRQLVDAATRTLENLEIHVTTLNPGLASHAPHRHANEEVVILHAGELDVFLNGETTRVGPGAVLVFLSNDWHAVTNVGSTPAVYHVINWTSAETLRLPAPEADEAGGG